MSGVAELHTLRRGAEREHVPGRTGDWDDWEDWGLGAVVGQGWGDWGLGNWELGLELPPPLAVFFGAQARLGLDHADEAARNRSSRREPGWSDWAKSWTGRTG